VANLKSGLRLAFACRFRFFAIFRGGAEVRQLLLLLLRRRADRRDERLCACGEQPTLSMHAIVYEGFEAAALLLMSAVLSAAFKQPHLKLRCPSRARQRSALAC